MMKKRMKSDQMSQGAKEEEEEEEEAVVAHTSLQGGTPECGGKGLLQCTRGPNENYIFTACYL